MAFIKLHRKILEWEWYQDANTFRLFTHLLLNASYEANRWQGIDIQPGQLITGRKKLADKLRLSEKQIRVALNHLKETGEVAIKTANKFSIITICKWEDYQVEVKTEGPTERPAPGPTEGQQRATTKEYKEREEEKNNISVNFSAQFDEFRKLYPGTKRGNETEFENFRKKHKDWQAVLPRLKSTIEKQISIRTEKEEKKEFVPAWKNLQTWINQRCWEEETTTPDLVQTQREPDWLDDLNKQRLTAMPIPAILKKQEVIP